MNLFCSLNFSVKIQNIKTSVPNRPQKIRVKKGQDSEWFCPKKFKKHILEHGMSDQVSNSYFRNFSYIEGTCRPAQGSWICSKGQCRGQL